MSDILNRLVWKIVREPEQEFIQLLSSSDSFPQLRLYGPDLEDDYELGHVQWELMRQLHDFLNYGTALPDWVQQLYRVSEVEAADSSGIRLVASGPYVATKRITQFELASPEAQDTRARLMDYLLLQS